MSLGGGLDFSYPLFFSLNKLKISDYYIYLCGWYILRVLASFTDVSFLALSQRTMLKTLKQLEVGVLRVPVVILVISKIKERICNLTIRLSSFPSGFLSPAHEVRGGVTTSKGMQQGHSSRCIRTKRCTDGMNTVSWKCFPIAKLIQTFAEGCKDNNSLKSPIIITTYNVCVHCFCVRN